MGILARGGWVCWGLGRVGTQRGRYDEACEHREHAAGMSPKCVACPPAGLTGNGKPRIAWFFPEN